MKCTPDLVTIASEVNALRAKRPGRRTIYPKNFKKKIASLIANGQSRKDVQKATGISPGAIDNWSRKFRPELPIGAEDLLPLPPSPVPPKPSGRGRLAIQLTCLRLQVDPEELEVTLRGALQALGGQS